MRSIILAGVLLALAACGGERGTPATESAPSGALALETYRGQWLYINYWAEWCAPCIKEIPELNELDHAHDDITVVGVNFDGARGEELQAQIDKLGVAFTTLPRDPASELGVARPAVLPTTFILDPDGAIHSTLVGPQTLDTLKSAIGR